MKRLFISLLMALFAMLMSVGCQGVAPLSPTAAPSEAPLVTDAPAATNAPTATEAVTEAPTATVAPTTAS